jgi:hypothetical protein
MQNQAPANFNLRNNLLRYQLFRIDMGRLHLLCHLEQDLSGKTRHHPNDEDLGSCINVYTGMRCFIPFSRFFSE